MVQRDSSSRMQWWEKQKAEEGYGLAMCSSSTSQRASAEEIL